MSSIAASADPAPLPAPGRPLEIEEWSNRRLIHPLSRALVVKLIPTGISPNAVSVLGAVMAAIAALCFLVLPWPASPLVGVVFLVAWHVFDGADGDLARRTGRASTNGELVDGICDHLGQLAIYLAFAVMLSPVLGVWAWALALGAGLSRAVQASAYEGCRRNYRRWVYGARWIRQNLPALDPAAGGPVQRVKVGLGLTYVAVSGLVSADDRALEAAMERAAAHSGETAAGAKQVYRERMLPLVKRASVLSANYRSLAIFLSLLAGTPLWFLLWELIGLNLVLLVLTRAEAGANRKVVDALDRIEAGLPAH